MTATRTYLIATAVAPLVIVALMVLPSLLARSQIESSLAGRTLAIVADESLLPAVRAELSPLGVTMEAAAGESGLADRVRARDLDGYVVFPTDVLGADVPRYVTDLAVDPQQGQLTDAIGRAVVRLRLERSGLDVERIIGLARIPEIQMLVLGKQTLPTRSELTRCTKSSRLTSTTWVLGISLVRYVPVFWMFRKRDGISELRSRSYIPDGRLAVRPDRAEALHR